MPETAPGRTIDASHVTFAPSPKAGYRFHRSGSRRTRRQRRRHPRLLPPRVQGAESGWQPLLRFRFSLPLATSCRRAIPAGDPRREETAWWRPKEWKQGRISGEFALSAASLGPSPPGLRTTSTNGGQYQHFQLRRGRMGRSHALSIFSLPDTRPGRVRLRMDRRRGPRFHAHHRQQVASVGRCVWSLPPANSAHLFVDGVLEGSARLPEVPGGQRVENWRIGGGGPPVARCFRGRKSTTSRVLFSPVRPLPRSWLFTAACPASPTCRAASSSLPSTATTSAHPAVRLVPGGAEKPAPPISAAFSFFAPEASAQFASLRGAGMGPGPQDLDGCESAV